MRILLVTNNYTPYSGGVVSSIVATCRALQDQGHDVRVVAPNFLGTAHDDPEWVSRIPSLFRFRYKNNYMAFMPRIKKYIREIITQFQPDVVHVHHPFLLGSSAVSLAKRMGIKTLFTYHTMYEAYAHYIPLPDFIVRAIMKRWVLRACRKVDTIIVPSSAMQAYLQSHEIAHTAILPSGLKEQFVGLAYAEKKLHSPYQLLYVGRFVKEKNITAIFDVMEQLPQEYELTLVGYGDYLDELKDYAYEKKKLTPERVRFLIKPEQSELVTLYQSAHLFLFPSKSDTQGIVIAEAMACSTPIIAFDGPGQRDALQTGYNGYIVENEQCMADTIQNVLSDQKNYAQLQKKAWQSARDYDPAELTNKLHLVYQQ